jgi:phosphoenolpyruvate-protein phosphotransferase (PTS system enzyme I)
MSSSMKLTGVGACEGVAVGPAFVYVPGELRPERERIHEGAVEMELKRFRTAVEVVVRKLSEISEKLQVAGSEEEAAIFGAHVEIADDSELISGVEERVRSLECPEVPVLAVGAEFAEVISAMQDEYLAARADDVRGVAHQIASELMRGTAAGLEALEIRSIVLTRNLAPSDTAGIPRGMVLGFVTAEGSRTSHVSIMARSKGIPAVVGVGPDLEKALGARMISMDGGAGYVVADPDADTVAEFESMSEAAATEKEALEVYKHVEARTREGRRIEVSANLGSVSEAQDALSWGAKVAGALARGSRSRVGRDRAIPLRELYGSDLPRLQSRHRRGSSPKTDGNHPCCGPGFLCSGSQTRAYGYDRPGLPRCRYRPAWQDPAESALPSGQSQGPRSRIRRDQRRQLCAG